MAKRNLKSISKNARSGIYFWGWLAVLCAIPMVAVAQDGRSAQVSVPSMIVGECDCDSITYQTTCTYTVFSGKPALSHLLFPIPANCANLFTVTSPYFSFSSPQFFKDRFCGEVYGIKANQELTEGQTTTFTIIYDGISPLGIDIVYANLKGGPDCQGFPVPGVVDCERLPCVEWAIDATVFDFLVRKPEVLAARLATMTIKANTPVKITFSAFGDLMPDMAVGQDPIAAFYATAAAEQIEPPEQFLTPAVFNQQIVSVPGDDEPHQFALWSKLAVEVATKACDYQNLAVITVIMENNTTWIDSAN